ncbi:MAG: hypothetical protein M3209_00380 [Acidobacteriota bacterium]|nr:hypothetical protein [Acidobacteriota bacterium]
MSRVKCFFAKETTKVRRYLRRHASGACPSKYRTFHNAERLFDEIEVPVPNGDGCESDERMISEAPEENEKSGYPTECEYCDYRFSDSDGYQFRTERLYRNEETSELYALRDLPPGAIYYASWMDRIYKPQLEHCIIVILPNGNPWMIDSQANNCTIPEDHNQRQHHCWIIEGKLPTINVSKNGKTCQAGAGSILSGSYHGFLRNGYLEEC